MSGAGVALVLTSAEGECVRAAEALFPAAERRSLDRAGLRPRTPFAGPLFELLGAKPRGACLGLVVPAVWIGPPGTGRDERAGLSPDVDPPAPPLAGRRGRTCPSPAAAADARAASSSGGVVTIADHVNLELSGPLSGRWPAGVPRDFPNMTGLYQLGDVRAHGGARVYSSGVVAAGVADARRLTDFEVRAVREGGWYVVSDSLIPAAIIAAYYGLRLAACGIVRAPERNRE